MAGVQDEAAVGIYLLRLMRDCKFANREHFISVACSDLGMCQEQVEGVLTTLKPSILRWIELEKAR